MKFQTALLMSAILSCTNPSGRRIASAVDNEALNKLNIQIQIKTNNDPSALHLLNKFYQDKANDKAFNQSDYNQAAKDSQMLHNFQQSFKSGRLELTDEIQNSLDRVTKSAEETIKNQNFVTDALFGKFRAISGIGLTLSGYGILAAGFADQTLSVFQEGTKMYLTGEAQGDLERKIGRIKGNSIHKAKRQYDALIGLNRDASFKGEVISALLQGVQDGDQRAIEMAKKIEASSGISILGLDPEQNKNDKDFLAINIGELEGDVKKISDLVVATNNTTTELAAQVRQIQESLAESKTQEMERIQNQENQRVAEQQAQLKSFRFDLRMAATRSAINVVSQAIGLNHPEAGEMVSGLLHAQVNLVQAHANAQDRMEKLKSLLGSKAPSDSDRLFSATMLFGDVFSIAMGLVKLLNKPKPPENPFIKVHEQLAAIQNQLRDMDDKLVGQYRLVDSRLESLSRDMFGGFDRLAGLLSQQTVQMSRIEASVLKLNKSVDDFALVVEEIIEQSHYRNLQVEIEPCSLRRFAELKKSPSLAAAHRCAHVSAQYAVDFSQDSIAVPRQSKLSSNRLSADRSYRDLVRYAQSIGVSWAPSHNKLSNPQVWGLGVAALFESYISSKDQWRAMPLGPLNRSIEAGDQLLAFQRKLVVFDSDEQQAIAVASENDASSEVIDSVLPELPRALFDDLRKKSERLFERLSQERNAFTESLGLNRSALNLSKQTPKTNNEVVAFDPYAGVPDLTVCESGTLVDRAFNLYDQENENKADSLQDQEYKMNFSFKQISTETLTALIKDKRIENILQFAEWRSSLKLCVEKMTFVNRRLVKSVHIGQNNSAPDYEPDITNADKRKITEGGWNLKKKGWDTHTFIENHLAADLEVTLKVTLGIRGSTRNFQLTVTIKNDQPVLRVFQKTVDFQINGETVFSHKNPANKTKSLVDAQRLLNPYSKHCRPRKKVSDNLCTILSWREKIIERDTRTGVSTEIDQTFYQPYIYMASYEVLPDRTKRADLYSRNENQLAQIHMIVRNPVDLWNGSNKVRNDGTSADPALQDAAGSLAAEMSRTKVAEILASFDNGLRSTLADGGDLANLMSDYEESLVATERFLALGYPSFIESDAVKAALFGSEKPLVQNDALNQIRNGADPEDLKKLNDSRIQRIRYLVGQYYLGFPGLASTPEVNQVSIYHAYLSDLRDRVLSSQDRQSLQAVLTSFKLDLQTKLDALPKNSPQD